MRARTQLLSSSAPPMKLPFAAPAMKKFASLDLLNETVEKIKVFLWKSLHGALPVGEQFAIRNIPVTSRCARCDSEESVVHLLFNCPYAKKVWELAPSASYINSLSFTSFPEGWNRVRKIPSLPPTGIEAGTFSAWIVWSIWCSRNQLIFEKRNFSPEETILKAISDAREWMMAQPPQNPNRSKPLIRLEPIPRAPDLRVIFTDAAWNPLTGNAGFGWIVDDLVSPSQYAANATFVSSPLMAETLAVLKAITFAQSRGMASILILSSSQVLINTINRRELLLEIYGPLCDIYHLLLSFMSECLFPNFAFSLTTLLVEKHLIKFCD
ncbi:uncharacterized protein LOC103828072 isoform X2 [Brassica rapa]|uniref:uncharacterized protein LOC103828072 isoform X2 n=1 Tax=Brassica campestris TaxID=3711 RepID=UPI000872E574|nr:uncharacterized protein LOC103828072 isoform X2 [Brassica rapa]